ncbi:TB2/DP1, HVA22 family-domain-containing protein [Cladochytrium replicatum]|nr:TB2/DP1, HVA22 family-domain-containing protein [Cladochytrium replicatum]
MYVLHPSVSHHDHQNWTKVDASLTKVKPLVLLEETTKIHKVHLVFGAAAALVILVMIVVNVGADVITDALGFVYPSVKSIDALDTLKKEAVVQWMSYWILIGFLHLLEYASPLVLHLIPYYYTFKLIFLIYLASPSTMGASKLHDLILKHLVYKPPPKPATPPSGAPAAEPPKPTASAAPKEPPKKEEPEKRDPALDEKPAPKRSPRWAYVPLRRVVR